MLEVGSWRHPLFPNKIADGSAFPLQHFVNQFHPLLPPPPPLSRREAELILAQAMGATREWIIAHPEAELNEDQHTRFDMMIAQMSRGMPLPYVLGEWEFFGLCV